MKRLIGTLFVCFCVGLFFITMFNSCDNKNNISPRNTQYFVKFYGGEGNQEGVDLKPTGDGGFILVGSSRSSSGDNRDSQIYLVKVDELGNEEWSKTFGTVGQDSGKSVLYFKDEAYWVAANVQAETNFNNIGLYKLDLQGNILDSTIIGDQGFDEVVYSISKETNGGVVIVGSSTNVSEIPKGGNTQRDTRDFFFPRVNAQLQQIEPDQWTKRFGFDSDDWLVSVIQKRNGDFLFIGTSDVFPPTNEDKDVPNMIIFQTNQSGMSDAGRTLFGGLDKEICYDAAPMTNGGSVLVGSSTPQQNQNVNRVFMVIINESNSIVRQVIVDTQINAVGKAIVEKNTGGFLIAADQIQSDNSANRDINIMSVNTFGEVLWRRSFGGKDDDFTGKLIQLPDNSIALIGTVTLENQKKMCLIKTNPNGQLNP